MLKHNVCSCPSTSPSLGQVEPSTGSPLSKRLNRVLWGLRAGRPLYQQCFVVRQGTPLEVRHECLELEGSGVFRAHNCAENQHGSRFKVRSNNTDSCQTWGSGQGVIGFRLGAVPCLRSEQSAPRPPSFDPWPSPPIMPYPAARMSGSPPTYLPLAPGSHLPSSARTLLPRMSSLPSTHLPWPWP